MERDGTNAVCVACGKSAEETHLFPAVLVRNGVAAAIRTDFPDWSDESHICQTDLNRYRNRYVEDLLESEKGDLTSLDRDVLESLREHETLSTDVEREFEKDLTLGERMADRIAAFGGSWRFILLFGGFALGWMAVNSIALLRGSFDPYPYILLNLVLSCLAALQAPVIMMSQNRQEAKDRLRSENDYQVNLKAELEIRHLNEKLDHLLSHQWERLVEIQQIQLDLMDEIVRLGGGTRPGRA